MNDNIHILKRDLHFTSLPFSMWVCQVSTCTYLWMQVTDHHARCKFRQSFCLFNTIWVYINTSVTRINNACYLRSVLVCIVDTITHLYYHVAINFLLVKRRTGSGCVGNVLSCMGCVKRKSLDLSCPIGNQSGYLLRSHVPAIRNSRCVRLQGRKDT